MNALDDYLNTPQQEFEFNGKQERYILYEKADRAIAELKAKLEELEGNSRNYWKLEAQQVRNVLATLPSLVEMARLHPEMSHEEAAAHWLSVPSSYRVSASYTASAELLAVLDKAEAELLELKTTAQALVNKLNIVHDSAAYMAVWTLYQAHQGPYTGPQYKDELDALEARLGGSAP